MSDGFAKLFCDRARSFPRRCAINATSADGARLAILHQPKHSERRPGAAQPDQHHCVGAPSASDNTSVEATLSGVALSIILAHDIVRYDRLETLSTNAEYSS